MEALVTRWVKDYGFKFLGPVLEGSSLDSIKQPEDEFEQRILDCLKAVAPKR